MLWVLERASDYFGRWHFLPSVIPAQRLTGVCLAMEANAESDTLWLVVHSVWDRKKLRRQTLYGVAILCLFVQLYMGLATPCIDLSRWKRVHRVSELSIGCGDAPSTDAISPCIFL